MVQKFSFVLRMICPKHHLLDVGVSFLRRVNLNALRLPHHTRGQGLNARRKSCREHHRLMTLNGQLIDFSQVIGKAQVKHAVRFIDHQKLHLFKFNVHGTLKIDQTPRRCNNQVCILQLGNLHGIGHATDNIGNSQAFAMLDQINGIMRDLLGQLARRTKNQSAWSRGLKIS